MTLFSWSYVDRFGTIPACDRQTDGETHGQTYDDSMYHHASIASRGKIDEAMITKLDINVSRWQPFNFGLKGQRSTSRVTTALPSWGFALLWVLASSRYSIACGVCLYWSRFELIFSSYPAWWYNKTKLVSFCSELPEIYENGCVTSEEVC